MRTRASFQETAARLDQLDSLRTFRDEFYLPERQIYLDGNSLGLASKRSEQALLRTLSDWKNKGIDGWQDASMPWYDMGEQLGGRVARLVGAKDDEVLATGSTTVNLHQILSTFYRPTATRYAILTDALSFPSDVYAIESQLMQRGLRREDAMVTVESKDGYTIDEDDIIAAMTDQVAIAILPSVLYRSGQYLDMKRLTHAAHERGILVAFDLCHSIGAIQHALHEWDVDFAFWCHYKYLNAGPGSVAGLYVNRRFHGTSPGLAGWFSSDKAKQFDMALTPTFAGDVGAYQIGTPHVFSQAPLAGSLDVFEEAGMENIRAKSLALTDFLIEIADDALTSFGFSIVTPRDANRRGGHIALAHPEAARIVKALKQDGVIPDFRAPDIVRLAPIALYTSFAELEEAMHRLELIMAEARYQRFENVRDVIA